MMLGTVAIGAVPGGNGATGRGRTTGATYVITTWACGVRGIGACDVRSTAPVTMMPCRAMLAAKPAGERRCGAREAINCANMTSSTLVSEPIVPVLH
jgi:hypothetical protein